MGGIAGIKSWEDSLRVSRPLIHQMCQTTVHRGLDDEGIYAANGVGPGMRRLSIIDIAGGHQPIHNEDKTVWVVLNGEIYNFPQLRQELVRAPLLDHLFVEWATSLPVKWKLRGQSQKYILKKRAERVGVPREVLHRPKQGFALPLVHWMRHELREDLARILLEPRSLNRGYFTRAVIENLLQEHFHTRRDRSSQRWLLLVFELWHRNFLESSAPHSRELSAVSIA